jgi:hypothetical protein
MPQPKDEPPDERLRQLYPDLSEKDLAEAGYNLDRYIEVVLRICESLRDPGRAEQIAELLAHVAASNPEKLQEIETRRAARPQNAPVPLDDLIEETVAKRPDILMTLISAPPLAYKIARLEEKRELISILTEHPWYFSKDREIEITLRKPFSRKHRPERPTATQ